MKSNLKIKRNTSKLIKLVDKSADINNAIEEMEEILTWSEFKVYRKILKEYETLLNKKYELEEFINNLETLPEEIKDKVLS